MNYCVTLETGAERKSDQLSSAQILVRKENSLQALSLLKKGQLITGTVVEAGEQVTLDFDGQKLTASKDVIREAVVGETKLFEVIKSLPNEMELRLIESTNNTFEKIMKAATVKDPDWKSIQAKKDQESKKSEKEKEVQEIKNKFENICSKFTAQDCEILEAESFAADNFSISGLLKAAGRMKKGSNRKEQSKASGSDAIGREEIAGRLLNENLPATAENLAGIENALKISKTAAKMDDKAFNYLISQDIRPTIENIYKACYSANTWKPQTNSGLSEEIWKELEPQVKSILTSAGYETNEKNLQDAKWLLEHDLSLTKETIAYKKDLGFIQNNVNQEQVLDRIIEGIKDGVDPVEVSLAVQQGNVPEQVMHDLHAITDEAVHKAVQSNTELTVRNLSDIQEKLSKIHDGESTEAAAVSEYDKRENIQEKEAAIKTTEASDVNPEEIRARRQLEEIRLKMTLEAAARLEKKGFSVETQQLEKVVEALKELEDSYYKERLREADVQASELKLQSLKETTQSLEQLKAMPCAILGNTLTNRYVQTIPSLLAAGSRQQAEYLKAGTAYEGLMTVPNSEYGDSIQKAFFNSEMLLSELNLDPTEQNKRAIRILGYNQMEITKDSIERVKAYDQEVTSLIKNLHPAVTVRLIKEGQNPLDMPVYELNDRIDQIKEEQGITSEDKFSTYLRNLEKENSLSEEERKAYLGIYRLLYNVEKSDGAAVGAVLNAFGEVTLDHLLTAVMTGKKGRLDTVINDEFGMLQELNRDKESISEQLASLYGEPTLMQKQTNTVEKDQIRYLNRMLRQTKDELTPNKLQELGMKLTESAAPSQQALSGTAALQAPTDSGIWGIIKDIPVEQLYEQLQMEEVTKKSNNEIYETKVRELRNLCSNSEQSLRFLSDFQVSATPMNIMIANHILSNGVSPITKLLKRREENAVKNPENNLKEFEEISDKLIDRSSMNEVYEKLEENAAAILNQACSEEKIDSQRLAELKSIGQQMSLLKTLSKKEFYQIPIETDQGVTTMNLTIIRGSGTTGKLSAAIGSESLGKIKAEISLKDRTIKGLISCDSRYGLEKLQSIPGEIERAAQESKVMVKQLDYVMLQKDMDSYSYLNPETGERNTLSDNNMERILYRLAKALVHTVQLAQKEPA